MKRSGKWFDYFDGDMICFTIVANDHFFHHIFHLSLKKKSCWPNITAIFSFLLENMICSPAYHYSAVLWHLIAASCVCDYIWIIFQRIAQTHEPVTLHQNYNVVKHIFFAPGSMWMNYDVILELYSDSFCHFQHQHQCVEFFRSHTATVVPIHVRGFACVRVIKLRGFLLLY